MQVNREKLAETIGVSLRTIDEYRRQGMPGEAPKRGGEQWRYDTAACISWLRQRERANALGEIAEINEAEARKRKLAAEAAMAELELAGKEGKVAPIEHFREAGAAMIGAARAKLLGVGGKVGPVVALSADPAECKAAIDDAIHEALQELSEFEPPEISPEPDGEDEPAGRNEAAVEAVGATAGSDRKRVGGRRKKAQPRKRR